jgi:hypothetical protein
VIRIYVQRKTGDGRPTYIADGIPYRLRAIMRDLGWEWTRAPRPQTGAYNTKDAEAAKDLAERAGVGIEWNGC